MTTFDALVTDARLRQALVSVRSLGRRGRSVAALDTRSDVPTFSSRWCRHEFVCQADEGTDAYLAELEEVLARTKARVLIASDDGTNGLIRRHRPRLGQQGRTAIADECQRTV